MLKQFFFADFFLAFFVSHFSLLHEKLRTRVQIAVSKGSSSCSLLREGVRKGASEKVKERGSRREEGTIAAGVVHKSKG